LIIITSEVKAGLFWNRA